MPRKTRFLVAALLVLILGSLLTLLLPRGGFRGRVVDSVTGNPVAGVRVSIPGREAGEAVTDGDGRFALGGEGLDAAALRAGAEGFVERTWPATAGVPAEIPLERGDTVIGRVLAAGGAPIPGARVSVHPRVAGLPVRAAVTGGDGRFRCGSVDRENFHNCVVRAGGHGRLVRDFNPARDGPGTVDLGDLVLPPARLVEGTFLGGRGQPVAGAALRLRGPLDLERACRAGGAAEDATTDADGRFRFEGVSPGRYTLGNDWGEGVPKVEKEIRVGDADLPGVELRIEQGGWLRVRVVDAAGAPVPGVTVTEDEGGLFARSGPDGVAVLENLPAGRRVSVTAQGGAGSWGSWPFVNLSVPEPALPDGGEVALVVARAAGIRGVVRGEDGEPLEGMVVGARGPERVPGGWGAYASTTKADGAFRLSVPEGAVVDLAARRPPGAVEPGTEVLSGRVAGVRAPAEGVAIVARAVPWTGSLVLRLLDPGGLPVAGVEVLVHAGGGAMRAARTDGAGRIALQGLLGEGLQPWIGVPPGGPGDPWPFPGGAALPGFAEVLPDGREVDVRLVPGAEIRGIVADPGGSPAAGARVFAHAHGWTSVEARSDDRGRFRVVVPAAEAALTLRALHSLPGGAALRAAAGGVRPGEGDLVLRLEER